MLGSKEKSLEILEKYTELVTGDIYPLQLKGDEYFNLIDQWIEELDLGNALPRDEKLYARAWLTESSIILRLQYWLMKSGLGELQKN